MKAICLPLYGYNKAPDKEAYETKWRYWFSTLRDTLYIDIDTENGGPTSTNINFYARQ